MTFDEILRQRRAIRRYAPKPVSDVLIKQILTAASLAPTAHNRQPQRILSLNSNQQMKQLAAACHTYDAPAALLICADQARAWQAPDGHSSADIDASIVTTYLMLKATDLGLGSVWIGNFNIPILQQQFRLSEQLKPISILLLGYPEQTVAAPVRQPIDWQELMINQSLNPHCNQ